MKKTGAIALLMVAMVSCHSFREDKNGITLYPKSKDSGVPKAVRVEVISDDIIHIRSFTTRKAAYIKSLVVDSTAVFQPAHWTLDKKSDSLVLQTASLRIALAERTGKIEIYDTYGNRKLGDVKERQSHYFLPKKVEGQDFYEIREVFDSPDDEAFYGLGAHQNGQVNYKGEDVELMQYNIADVVPFLLSSKNFGILWDNYSISRFGDPRAYGPLSVLELSDETGRPGGLTAHYYTDREKKDVFLSRDEQTIGYKYTKDLKKVPEGYRLEDGVIEWKGFLKAGNPGLYKFNAYASGYLKIWIDSTLVLDCWRQTWNPWTRKFKVAFGEGQQIPIKVEWIPDGRESYMALECLTPFDPEEQKDLSFYSEAAKCIDYYFINGDNADSVISGYRKLTGKSPIMPEWAMGLWQSRERYKTSDELLGVVKEYRRRQIPLDNIVLDWHYWEENKWGDHGFDRQRFPDPSGMCNELHDQLHARIMISVWPKYYESTKNYEIMKKNGWLYMENINNRQKDWVGPGYVSTFYDAFNAEARNEYWKQLYDSLYLKGVDAWWMDATEPDILSNTSPADRKKLMSTPALGPAEVYFNAYSLLQTEAVYKGQRTADPDKRVFILTRSAFAGQQRNASATWSGDVASRWSDLKDQIAAGVNMGASGIPYWTTDIGGFSIENRYYNLKGEVLDEWRELNLRWYQFGAFCPLFRIHGQFPFREVYNISPEGHPVYKSMVFYDRLRYRLMPYIYTLAGWTWHRDYTIMRPLVMDHPGDPEVLDIEDEYMFGPGLLICPVYAFKAHSRDVYLPADCGWYDLLTGKYYEGGKTYAVEAPLEKIPVFAKEGAIVPMGPEMQYTGEKPADPLTLYIFDGKNGEFTLYEDDGTTYGYEKGAYATIQFNYDSRLKKLNIGKLEGDYPGLVRERTINVKLITVNSKGGIDAKGVPLTTIDYSGDPVEIELK
jgi:alpha-D-xyloside xylohydrolase